MIEVEHLSKIYGSTTAIDDISFTVEPGTIVGFLGPNGAGKTTTMRILAGYLPATIGTAKIAGYDVHKQSMAVRKRIGYLPETPPLYPDMTVEGFLDFVARIKGVKGSDRKSNVSTAIERCQLVDKRKILIRKLSKGYRQRVGIAQAIVHDPPVIILDEPTIGLDPRQIIEVRNLIKSLAGQHTIILSTHILPEVSMTCDRVTVINRGKVVAVNLPANPTDNSGYELEIAGDINQIEALLRSINQVSRLDVIQSYPEENRHRLRLISDSDIELGRDISTLIVNQGLGLYEMRKIRPSLEDLFLELTTQERIAEVDSQTPSTEAEIVSEMPEDKN